jgi:hypothetical protein
MAMLGAKEGPIVGRAKEFLIDEALKRRRALTLEDCSRLLARWRDTGPGKA